MPRVALALALLVTSAAVAAPVPKALKKSAVPRVAGTTWVGKNVSTDGPLDIAGESEYTFDANGRFTTKRNGQPYSNGTWKQDGDTVEWEFNNRYSVYTVTFKDGGFEGTGNNVKGRSWAVTLKAKE